MKKILFVLTLLCLVSCDSFNKQPATNSKPANTVADILEENKESLNYIKNRTADDIELGNAARHMVVQNTYSDEELGSKVREIVLKQPTTPQNVTESYGRKSQSPERKYFSEFCLIVLITIGVCSLFQCIVHFIWRKRHGQSQKDDGQVVH